eukprot:31228-Pelagococcus_subviridis.AAC.4
MQTRERDDREREPRGGDRVQRVPEQRLLGRAHRFHALRVARFEPPTRDAALVDLVPVPQPDEQPPAEGRRSIRANVGVELKGVRSG